MSHEIDFSTGVPAVAYAGEVPWHGLGARIDDPNMPLEKWREAAQLDWEYKLSPLACRIDGFWTQMPSRRAIVRSDTEEPLGIVSDRYKLVQPMEVIEFFRSLIDQHGFQMETAGALKSGRKIWALARVSDDMQIAGNDAVSPYVLLATGVDGELATTASFTTVRVVCNNTFTLAMEKAENTGSVKVTHSQVFDPTVVKGKLNIGSTFDNFTEQAQRLSRFKLTDKQTVTFLLHMFGDATKELNDQPNVRNMKLVYGLYKGKGIGSDMQGSHGTAWGLFNAMTEFTDFARKSISQDTRLHSAWFGPSNRLKQRAWDYLLREEEAA